MEDLHTMNDIVRSLPLEERAALLSGDGFWQTAAVESAGIPSVYLSDGPHGVRRQDDKADHLGLNASLPATAFPTASATACSWNRDLLSEIGRALAAEARGLGVDVLLGPGLNIKRSPLCGRNFEYFSEDPLLAGELGTAWVNGLQSGGVGASLKHFAANDQETGRMRISSEVDERTLRELHLRVFERVVKAAKPATVMASYNRINGVRAMENDWLLTTVLRDEWGYQGAVVSDWGGVEDPVASVRAGLDLQMPGNAGVSARALIAAANSGDLSEEKLDKAAARIITLAKRWSSSAPAAEFDPAAHHDLARRAASESAVLLRNNGVLPLAGRTSSLTVVGEFARTPRYQGAGSSHLVPTRVDNALDALRNHLPDQEVVFEPGFLLDGAADDALAGSAVAAAAAAASRGDDVVLFLGLPDIEESEGFDRKSIDLPANQLHLLNQLTEVHPDIVVVLSNGGVVSVSGWDYKVGAVLEMWLGGQASGAAAAELLLGKVAPSGRLAESIPLRIEDTPTYLNFPGDKDAVIYGERIYVGYRFYDTVGHAVAYPFGHGLTYTTFEYSNLNVTMDHPSSVLRAELEVTNTGSRSGTETVQIYAAPPVSSVDRPAHELVGFERVALEPGERRSVTVTVPLGNLDFYSVEHSQWVRSAGEYEIQAAASSRDVRLISALYLESTEPAARIDLDSTMGEWYSDTVGAKALRKMLYEFLEPEEAEHDEDTMRVIAEIPLKTMLPMMLTGRGIHVQPERIERMVAEAQTP
jgi:beta-glucosidase